MLLEPKFRTTRRPRARIDTYPIVNVTSFCEGTSQTDDELVRCEAVGNASRLSVSPPPPDCGWPVNGVHRQQVLESSGPSVRPPVRPPVRPSVCPSARPPVRPPVCPSVCPPAHHPARRPAHRPAHRPARRPAHSLARPPACSPTCPPTSPGVQ